MRSCLNFIRKYFYLCEAGFGFFESVLGIFPFLSFGNSPLFPARCERKSTLKQLSNNSEIKFKQLLNSVCFFVFSLPPFPSLPRVGVLVFHRQIYCLCVAKSNNTALFPHKNRKSAAQSPPYSVFITFFRFLLLIIIAIFVVNI